MSANIALADAHHSTSPPTKILHYATNYWLVVTIIGQLAFLIFIVGFYWTTSLTGNFEGWTKNKILPYGYIARDPTGNLIFAFHVVVAALVAFGGVLQLTPQIRTRFPTFHRWNGRVFLLAILAVSSSGLFLNWWREAGTIAITINGTLILLFATLAWRAARQRDFQRHRALAMHTFMLACGVWFLRLGMFAWFIIAVKLLGAPELMTEAFMTAWGFGCYLAPMACVALYLRAEVSEQILFKRTVAIVIFAMTSCMVLGIVALGAVMWLPLLRV
jgi:uncharacterized membrane protein